MTQALLVMDVQEGIVARYADDDGLLDRLAAAIDAARGADVPVIFVRVAFRPGFPEVSPNNRSFSALTADTADAFSEDGGAAIHAKVAPQGDEPVVTKKRVSAFAGSDLEVILRSSGIDHLVLTGIATSGVVLSTLRQAADLDYRLTVLSDGCADRDSEVHRVLLEKLFPRQADVVTVEQWIGSMTRADG
jgi:nicotinamidase-related amidase